MNIKIKKRRDELRISHFGGKGWIRTTEVADDRFTVCSLWPLGNLPIIFGAGDWNRTRNLLITNQLLCQLSYTSDKLGASGRNRTTDTGIFSPLLYRLSYRGMQVVFWKCLQKNTSIFIWRPGRGSNPRPPAWQAGVLTICTTGPNI